MRNMGLIVDFKIANGSKLFCLFINFRRAFDTVDRHALYQKMFIVTYYFFSIPAKLENPLARELVSGNRNRTNKLFFCNLQMIKL